MRSLTSILAVIGVLSLHVNAEVENPLYNLFRRKELMQMQAAGDMRYFSPYSGKAFQKMDGILVSAEVADDGTVHGV
jgi:hypothetical protein